MPHVGTALVIGNRLNPEAYSNTLSRTFPPCPPPRLQTRPPAAHGLSWRARRGRAGERLRLGERRPRGGGLLRLLRPPSRSPRRSRSAGGLGLRRRPWPSWQPRSRAGLRLLLRLRARRQGSGGERPRPPSGRRGLRLLLRLRPRPWPCPRVPRSSPAARTGGPPAPSPRRGDSPCDGRAAAGGGEAWRRRGSGSRPRSRRSACPSPSLPLSLLLLPLESLLLGLPERCRFLRPSFFLSFFLARLAAFLACGGSNGRRAVASAGCRLQIGQRAWPGQHTTPLHLAAETECMCACMRATGSKPRSGSCRHLFPAPTAAGGGPGPSRPQAQAHLLGFLLGPLGRPPLLLLGQALHLLDLAWRSRRSGHSGHSRHVSGTAGMFQAQQAQRAVGLNKCEAAMRAQAGRQGGWGVEGFLMCALWAWEEHTHWAVRRVKQACFPGGKAACGAMQRPTRGPTRSTASASPAPQSVPRRQRRPAAPALRRCPRAPRRRRRPTGRRRRPPQQPQPPRRRCPPQPACPCPSLAGSSPVRLPQSRGPSPCPGPHQSPPPPAVTAGGRELWVRERR